MGRKYFDISITLRADMVVYEGDPAVSIREVQRIADGSVCNVSELRFGSHTGTHMDAPKHFVDDGLSVDQLSLDYFLGKAKVFDMGDVYAIEPEALYDLPIEEGDRVLFKTKNSPLLRGERFVRDFVYISGPAAEYLASKKIRTVGIDYLSVERFGAEPLAHWAFLRNNIVILEGLDLSAVPPGEYELICLPLKLAGGNGSPMRAVLAGEE